MTSLLKRLAAQAVPCLAGAASALLVVLALPDRSPEAAPAPAPAPAPMRPGDPADHTAARLHALERRVTDVASRVAAQPVQSDEDELPPEIVADRARLRDEGRARWRRELDDHRAEASDPAWGPAAAARFEADLAALAPTVGFRPLGARCASTTCTAQVEFQTFDAATRGFEALLIARYAENCGTKTVLEEPGDPDAPYVATVLYDCAEVRLLPPG